MSLGRFSPARRAAFAKVVSVEETEGSHILSDRQWKKLVSKLLAHQVLSTLLYAVKKLEVRIQVRSLDAYIFRFIYNVPIACLIFT